MTQAATDTSIPRLIIAEDDASEFLKAVGFVKHALPNQIQKEAKRDLYAYCIDKAYCGGYVTAADGHRISKWVFYANSQSPEFHGHVSVDDVEAYRNKRKSEMSIPLAKDISYPDVWRTKRYVMLGAINLGRVINITSLLRAVSAFENAKFDSIMVEFQGAIVRLTAEDAEMVIDVRVPNAMDSKAKAIRQCCINPEHLADALRAIERGKPSDSDVFVELSPKAIRFLAMRDAAPWGDELIMLRNNDRGT
jgi:hypothetical protein